MPNIVPMWLWRMLLNMPQNPGPVCKFGWCLIATFCTNKWKNPEKAVSSELSELIILAFEAQFSEAWVYRPCSLLLPPAQGPLTLMRLVGDMYFPFRWIDQTFIISHHYRFYLLQSYFCLNLWMMTTNKNIMRKL